MSRFYPRICAGERRRQEIEQRPSQKREGRLARPPAIFRTKRSRETVSIQPDMVGMVVRDMAAALRFYRLLGLAVPDGQDAEPYVEVITANGYRLSLIHI